MASEATRNLQGERARVSFAECVFFGFHDRLETTLARQFSFRKELILHNKSRLSGLNLKARCEKERKKDVVVLASDWRLVVRHCFMRCSSRIDAERMHWIST